MFNLVFDFEKHHNENVPLSKYNDMKLEFQNMLEDYEEATKSRDTSVNNLRISNAEIEKTIDKIQDIVFDIGT